MASVIQYLEKQQRPGIVKNDGPGLDYSFMYKRLICKKNNVYSTDEYHYGAPPFACKFRRDSANHSHILALAMEEGDVSLVDTNASSKKMFLKKWTAHNNAVFDLCWAPDRPVLVTGSGDNTVVLWDAATSECIQTFSDHLGSVKCVDVCPRQSALIASGARDGKINVWDTRVNHSSISIEPELSIRHAHRPSSEENIRKRIGRQEAASQLRSVTSVAFQNEYLLASAGVGDQTVKIWDLRKTYISKQPLKTGPAKYRTPTPIHCLFYGGDGCTSMVFDSTYKNLYACCTNSVIHRYDCHSYESHYVSSYHGFYAATYFVKMAISPDDQYLLCGNSNEEACIWKVSKPGEPLYHLAGHTAEVTAVAWHPNDVTRLVTCGDDNQAFIWQVAGKDVTNKTEGICGTTNSSGKGSSSSLTPSQSEIEPPNMYTRSSLINISIAHYFRKSSQPYTPSTDESSASEESSPPIKRRKASEQSDLLRSVLTPKRIANEENLGDRSPVIEESLNAARNTDIVDAAAAESPSPIHEASSSSQSLRSPRSCNKKNTYCRTPRRRKNSSKETQKKKERPITSYFQGTP